jgi:hypothetical protein
VPIGVNGNCQFSPIMAPLIFGQNGPLPQVTIARFLTKKGQTIGVCLGFFRRFHLLRGGQEALEQPFIARKSLWALLSDWGLALSSSL